MSRPIHLVIAFAIASVSPITLRAQAKPCPKGLAGALCRFGKTVDKMDSTSHTRNDQGGAVGAGIRIVSPPTLENADAFSGKYDTSGTGIRREPRPCSSARACVTGWDLRALSLSAPSDTVPAISAFPVTIGIENRGKVSSPASEMVVCLTPAYDSQPSRCERRLALVEIPPLSGGERASVKQAVRLNKDETEFRIAAFIDPDNGTGELNRANNTALSATMNAAEPEIEWLSFDVPSTARKGAALPIRIRLRNRSFHAKTSPLELGFFVAGENFNDARVHLPLPAIGPRQILSFEVLVGGLDELIQGSVGPPDVENYAWKKGPQVMITRR